MTKTGRPQIPIQTQRELWAKSAGRCEFRGCNKILFQDGLTQKKSNLAKISHIVAYSKDGPRGDPIDSPKLSTEISNLMLTCGDHAKIIDDKDKEKDYPVKLLRAYKKEHEERIKKLTNITEDSKTHVLIVQAPIHGKPVEIDTKQAHLAVLPLYPTNEDGYLVNLNGISVKESSDGYWTFMASAIRQQLTQKLRVGAQGGRPKNISVFALAPIPLLVFLGEELDDKGAVNLFQRHRQGPKPWNWREEDEEGDWYQVNKREVEIGSKDIALVLSISENIGRLKYKGCFEGEFTTYEIKASQPGVDFLKSKKRLNAFSHVYRKTLCEIRERHGSDCKIHLFPAVPAPIAVACGQSLLPKTDPAVLVYEYHKDSNFTYALTVNN